MTLNDLERRVTTADPRYLCGSWAFCLLSDWLFRFRYQLTQRRQVGHV